MTCKECNSGYSIDITNLICTLFIVEDCLTYAYDSDGRYDCKSCQQGHSYVGGIGSSLCISTANVTPNCIQYKDEGLVEVCLKCTNSFSLADVTSGSEQLKKCLSKATEVINYCIKYEL